MRERTLMAFLISMMVISGSTNVFANVSRETAESEVVNIQQTSDDMQHMYFDNMNAYSIQDLETKAAEYYNMWDVEINVLWGYLRETLDPDSMEKLRQKQVQWIYDKEDKMAETERNAKAGYGAYYRDLLAGDMTKDRIYELLEYLPYNNGIGSVQSGFQITGESQIASDYDAIVQEYCNAIAYSWSVDEFREHNMCYLCNYNYGGSLEQVGYCLYDMDGDSQEELLIGLTSNENGMIFDAYKMVDGVPKLILTSGERDRYYICENYYISEEGSGGAGYSMNACYMVDQENGELIFTDGVVYDAETDQMHPWFRYGNKEISKDTYIPLSDEEAIAIQNSYIKKKVVFVPFSSYQIGSIAGNVSQTEQPVPEPEQTTIEPEPITQENPYSSLTDFCNTLSGEYVNYDNDDVYGSHLTFYKENDIARADVAVSKKYRDQVYMYGNEGCSVTEGYTIFTITKYTMDGSFYVEFTEVGGDGWFIPAY